MGRPERWWVACAPLLLVMTCLVVVILPFDSWSYARGVSNRERVFSHENVLSAGSGEEIPAVILGNSSGNAWLESPSVMAVDDFHNTFVTGTFSGSVDLDPGPGVSVQQSSEQKNSALVKLDASQKFVWQRTFKSPKLSRLDAVTVSTAGDVFVFGTFDDLLILPNADVLAESRGGNQFVAKFNLKGELLWSRQIDSSLSHVGLNVDNLGNLLMSGAFSGMFKMIGSSEISSASASEDVVVVKLDGLGAFQWAYRPFGRGDELSPIVKVDKLGHLFLAFETDFVNSSSSISMGWHTKSQSDYQVATRGGADVIVAVFDISGTNTLAGLPSTYPRILSSGVFGGSTDDFLTAFDLDGRGNSYLLMEHYWGSSCAAAGECALDVAPDSSSDVYSLENGDTLSVLHRFPSVSGIGLASEVVGWSSPDWSRKFSNFLDEATGISIENMVVGSLGGVYLDSDIRSASDAAVDVDPGPGLVGIRPIAKTSAEGVSGAANRVALKMDAFGSLIAVRHFYSEERGSKLSLTGSPESAVYSRRIAYFDAEPNDGVRGSIMASNFSALLLLSIGDSFSGVYPKASAFSLTFTLRKSGQRIVASGKAFASVKVKLQRQVGRRWVTVGVGTSRPSGAFRVVGSAGRAKSRYRLLVLGVASPVSVK